MPNFFDQLRLADATRTVWIFGAGASVAPYGVPVQANVLRHFATMTRPGPEAVQRGFTELRARVRAHCRNVLPGLAMEHADVTLEELFSAYELGRDDPRSTRAEVSAAHEAFDDLLQALRLATYSWGRGDSQKWLPHRRAGTPSPYAELLEKLAPPGANGPIAHALMTFNYDVNLDKCLLNLRGGAADYDVDYGVMFANGRCPDAPSFEPPRPGQSILLLRNHGALNWIRCRACRNVFTTLGRQQEIPEDLRCYACGKLTLDYVLVHPSYNRTYDDPVLQLVWGRAYEELTKADRWIFVGYSLPSVDVHFRELLRDCLRVRTNAGRDTSIVLAGRGPQPDADFARAIASYEALFQAKLSVWRATARGFTDFVNAIV